MVDGIMIIYFVLKNFEFKDITNFNGYFLGVMFGDRLRIDEWKRLKRQTNEITREK